MREVKFFAYLGVLTTFVATIMAVALSISYYYKGPCLTASPVKAVCSACEHDLVLTTIASGFSVYSFAFGGHSSIPNFFMEMRHPRHFYKTTAVVFPTALILIYLPMAITGYLAYGRGLDQATGTILDAILFYDPSSHPYIVAVNVILTLHLLTALPILTTPICLYFQRAFIKTKAKRFSRSLPMILTRAIIIAVLTLIAVVFPYFLQMISIVTDLSVVLRSLLFFSLCFPSLLSFFTSSFSLTLSVYIFPAVFYWKLRTNSRKHGVVKTVFVRIGLVLIIAFGVAGSGFGLANAIPSLIHAVKTGGNPFKGLFSFHCHSGGGTAPSFNDSVCIIRHGMNFTI